MSDDLHMCIHCLRALEKHEKYAYKRFVHMQHVHKALLAIDEDTITEEMAADAHELLGSLENKGYIVSTEGGKSIVFFSCTGAYIDEDWVFCANADQHF